MILCFLSHFEQPNPFPFFAPSSLSFFSFLFSTRGMLEFKSKEEGNGREGGGEEDKGRSKGGKKMESREETCVGIYRPARCPTLLENALLVLCALAV